MWAVQPQAAQPTPTPYLGEQLQAAQLTPTPYLGEQLQAAQLTPTPYTTVALSQEYLLRDGFPGSVLSTCSHRDNEPLEPSHPLSATVVHYLGEQLQAAQLTPTPYLGEQLQAARRPE